MKDTKQSKKHSQKQCRAKPSIGIPNSLIIADIFVADWEDDMESSWVSMNPKFSPYEMPEIPGLKKGKAPDFASIIDAAIAIVNDDSESTNHDRAQGHNENHHETGEQDGRDHDHTHEHEHKREKKDQHQEQADSNRNGNGGAA